MASTTFVPFADPKSALGPGDVVIVGAGLAGLFTALRLAPLPVTVVAAAPLGEGASSVWAQGGVAAAVGEGDTPEAHARDTVIAGAGIVDETVASTIASEAADRIRDLLAYGVPFDRDLAGGLVLSREAAHSANRIVRVSGDRAGAAIMQALIASVRLASHIKLLEGYEADDLIMEDGRVKGVRLVRSEMRGNGTFAFLPASAVVLATGGVGSLFAVTTNPPHARGEALAFAARAGAVVADAEFVQFHPTAIDIGSDPAPLATEALRGEGAVLLNKRGERFMLAQHPDAELAPRDVVARAVFNELTWGRGAFLDCRKAIGKRFPVAFPTVYAHCRAAGIDPITELIPVAPAAHYHMGGIATDLRARSSVAGLWAVGEVASTGLHGANRLASNSLLEAVVLGARAAADIQQLVTPTNAAPIAKLEPVDVRRSGDKSVRRTTINRLRKTMTTDVGVVRDAAGLRRALGVLAEIEARAGTDRVLGNMALAGRLIAASALKREESRGGHARRDFPAPSHSWSHRSYITAAELETIRAEAETKPMAKRAIASGRAR
jgi:L-aspartate oxidase